MSKEKEVIENYAFKSRDAWHEALQEAPNAKWIKSRDVGAGNKSRYVPIGIQEALGDIFFREFDIIDNRVEIYNNQILITVKVSALPNYPHAEHRIYSGIAAKPLGTKGNSLEPKSAGTQASAKSNVFTNLGNVFGRNLNREFSDGFSYTKKKEEKDKKQNNE